MPRQSVMWLGIVVIAGALAAGGLWYRNLETKPSGRSADTHVVLIGASIGQGWKLEEWPARTRMPGMSVESIAAWQFDKTGAVEEVLMRPARRFRFTPGYLKSLLQPPPARAEVVVIKQCSSYFPGELNAYQGLIRRWVERLQAARVKVVLATVAPVTRARARQAQGKQESLVAFNRWIREYAAGEGLAVLDLEKALSAGGDGRYLREELASPDGSHLNPGGYAVLDEALRPTLFQAVAQQVKTTAVRERTDGER